LARAELYAAVLDEPYIPGQRVRACMELVDAARLTMASGKGLSRLHATQRPDGVPDNGMLPDPVSDLVTTVLAGTLILCNARVLACLHACLHVYVRF